MYIVHIILRDLVVLLIRQLCGLRSLHRIGFARWSLGIFGIGHDAGTADGRGDRKAPSPGYCSLQCLCGEENSGVHRTRVWTRSEEALCCGASERSLDETVDAWSGHCGDVFLLVLGQEQQQQQLIWRA